MLICQLTGQSAIAAGSGTLPQIIKRVCYDERCCRSSIHVRPNCCLRWRRASDLQGGGENPGRRHSGQGNGWIVPPRATLPCGQRYSSSQCVSRPARWIERAMENGPHCRSVSCYAVQKRRGQLRQNCRELQTSGWERPVFRHAHYWHRFAMAS